MAELFSVVIPVFNSEGVIRETVLRVREQFLRLGERFEVILVNDGSRDDSWRVIAAVAREFEGITAINLLKNYGQHHANLCGFRQSRGDYVITMDDDLQNPPEEIEKLVDAARKGFDLVIGKFEAKRHSLVRRLGSRLVMALNRRVFEVDDRIVLSNFRIIRREVVDRVCQDRSFSPYIPGMVLKYSANRTNVLVRHEPRASGKSNYTWLKIARLVSTILFNHSSIPLRYAAGCGFMVAVGSFCLSAFFLLNALYSGTRAPGWASLAVLLSFFNGVLILILSVMGEYVIRILREISTVRSYEIREVVSR